MSKNPQASPAAPGPLVRAGWGVKSDHNAATPSVSGTIAGWFCPLRLTITRVRIVSNQAQEYDECVVASGIIQPFKDQDLKVLSEGQRAWRWSSLHISASFGLKVGDYVSIRGVKYKVMSEKDWSDYGYFRFGLVEAFNGRNPTN